MKPRRGLVIVGGGIDPTPEQVKLEHAFAQRRGDVLWSWSFAMDESEIKLWIRKHQPELIHFVGHARIHEGEACLVLESEGGNTYWPGSRLRDLLEVLEVKPELVVLNACYTGVAEGGDLGLVDLVKDVTGKAAVGHRKPIADSHAVLFAEGFYGALCERKTIEESLKEGQDNIKLFGDGRASKDADHACLATDDPGFRLFPDNDPHDEVRTKARTTRESCAALFANRTKEQLEFMGAGEGSARVILVHGRPQSGKTKFVLHCLERFVLQGYQVRYVDFKPPDQNSTLPGLLGALLAIIFNKRFKEDEVFDRPLDEAIFEPFLAEVRKHQDLPGNADLEKRLPDEALESEPLKRLLRTFVECLNAHRGEAILCLVLDHLAWLPPDLLQKDGGLTELIRLCAQSEGLHVVINAGEDRRNSLKTALDGPSTREIEIGLLPGGAGGMGAARERQELLRFALECSRHKFRSTSPSKLLALTEHLKRTFEVMIESQIWGPDVAPGNVATFVKSLRPPIS